MSPSQWRVEANDIIAGRYRLLRPVGAGAMGTVWAARHELVGRDYAIKIASSTARDARELFLREVRIVGALRHRNVVDIADAGEADDDGLYLAMELLEGESLADRIARAPLPPEDALAIAAGVCLGLAAAHAAGVIHRDVKPENVYLAREPSGAIIPKLLDFGVSSIRGASGAGRLYGTPAYMSPEQALGAPDVDHRVDLWATGVMLYEMLTGRRPFDAESYPALLPIIIEQPHPPLPASIPRDVADVVDRCLAKAIADRYPSADALLEAIVHVRGGDAVEGLRAPARPAPARRTAIAAVIAAIAVVGIGAAVAAQRSDTPTAALAASAPTEPNEAPSASVVVEVPAPPPSPASSVASTATSTAPKPTSAAPARAASAAPPRPKAPVTKVDSAGF